MSINEPYMVQAANHAAETMKMDIGGPFGAVITKDDKVIALQSNTVLKDKDPTCHAEINAIRDACNALDTYDLSGCELYATGYPCPMCMSAIIWANIKKVHVSGLPEDAEAIGFRDQFIYDYIRNNCEDDNVLEIKYEDRTVAKNLYSEYSKLNKTIY